MKTVVAFFKLIRWPNLFFIALTQIIFYSFIYAPLKDISAGSFYHDTYFLLLVVASMMIAAAGYIINDYFDLHIDRVNKPEKVVVDKMVKRRWAIVWHLLLSIAGIVLTAIAALHQHKWYLIPLNILSVGLLWVYSTTFKKKLLSGNWIISLLTAWVILVVYFHVNTGYDAKYVWFTSQQVFDVKRFFKLTIVYAGFAFIMTLIREAVKDMEDLIGDAQFGCTTLPVKWGVPVAKMYTAVWMIVVIASLVVMEIYAYQSGKLYLSLYCNFLLVLPLLFCMKWLYKAAVPTDYHRISNWLKLVMLAGILSMVFFK